MGLNGLGINKQGIRNIIEEYLGDYKTREKFSVEYLENKIVIYPKQEEIKEVHKNQQVLKLY